MSSAAVRAERAADAERKTKGERHGGEHSGAAFECAFAHATHTLSCGCDLTEFEESKRSPVGSPTRSVLSRVHIAQSPSTTSKSSAAMQLPRSVASSPIGVAQARTHGVLGSPSGSGAPSDSPTPEFSLGSRDVTLADRYLKDEGCSRVVHELLGRGADLGVVSLDLRGNDIRRYGAEAIGELMRENATIQSLNLEWNFLGDSGGTGSVLESGASETAAQHRCERH